MINPFILVVSNGFAGIFVQYGQLLEFYRRWFILGESADVVGQGFGVDGAARRSGPLR